MRVRMVLARKRPFVVAAGLVVAGLLLICSMPILRMVNAPKFRAPISQEVSTARSASDPLTVIVQEPEFEFRYEVDPTAASTGVSDSTAIRRRQEGSPETVLDTPSGGSLRILAIAVATNLQLSKKPARRGAALLYGPDLKPLSSKVRAELEELYGPDGIERVVRTPFQGFHAGGITLVLEERGATPGDKPTVTLLDPRNGRVLSMSSNSTSTTGGGNAGNRHHSWGMGIESFGVGPVELVVRWIVETERVPIELKAGWRKVVGGKELRLMTITRSMWGTVTSDHDPTAPVRRPTQVGASPDNEMQLDFENLDGDFRLLAGTTGSSPGFVRSSWRSGNLSSFILDLGKDNITTAVLSRTKAVDFGIFRFPYLPGFLEENRSVTDATQIRVPPVVFATEGELVEFLGENLRCTGGVTAMGAGFPMEFPATTLGEIFARYRELLPPHALRITMGSNGEFQGVSVVPPRATLVSVYPRLGWVVVSLPWIGLGLAALGFVVFCAKMLTLIAGARLRGELSRKGFAEVTLFDAEELWLRLTRRAKLIPNFDEIATVPGVNPHDMASIAKFMEEQHKEVSKGGSP